MNIEKSAQHSVEKIGGTSMSDYEAVRDNIVMRPGNRQTLYQRIFVVSAYSGVTNDLLEHKKSGQPGVYGLFASGENDDGWCDAMAQLQSKLHNINSRLFTNDADLQRANRFIDGLMEAAHQCLTDLQGVCRHGHFSLTEHLDTVREMLASIGEAHSAWNTAALLQRDGVNTCFVDLSGWQTAAHVPLMNVYCRHFLP